MMKTGFNTLTYWNKCTKEQQQVLLTRPAISASGAITEQVASIISQVRNEGDKALKALSQKFDKAAPESVLVTKTQVDAAAARLDSKVKQAIAQAMGNIRRFHEAQIPTAIEVETQAGVFCQQVSRPINAVGLYIPGGSAPLLSTVMMLGIPAQIAGCRKIILCSPPPIADEILYIAKEIGIDDIFQVGGAQAIAAMAFGTKSIAKVDKIFGPGNAYVTEAKRQASQSLQGAAIDMPAGPSEVLVIADANANPAFIAADLLSQAEHGPDSQVVLLTPDETLAKAVIQETETQLALLSRAEIAKQALAESRVIIARDIQQCIEISNSYGPEHLIIQTDDADDWVDSITSAGSVFLGAWSPESAGDYASGTNHVLPTYGYTATYSSLGLADFMKRMTVQKLTAQGLSDLAQTIEILAEAEQLTAHKNAVTLRVKALAQGNK
ncbi:MAG TPA: histidinol dehydrogenase [Proteus sp.]|nr:histidinol dehydrogenase [Proteus sp. (in: enterobacteria)]